MPTMKGDKMKFGRLLLCAFTLAITLWASQASANPAMPCDQICNSEVRCSTRCSIWDDQAHYTNVTCGFIGACNM
jgi:hypothetical protein